MIHTAQQARFAAMQPGQISQHWAEQNAARLAFDAAVDQLAFDAAVEWATKARALRAAKRQGDSCHSPGRLEALAREAERHVRQIAAQSEIILRQRAQAARADRAMLGIMLGAAS